MIERKALPWWAYVMMTPAIAAGLYVFGWFVERVVEMGGG